MTFDLDYCHFLKQALKGRMVLYDDQERKAKRKIKYSESVLVQHVD
jgi:hypothetical protein